MSAVGISTSELFKAMVCTLRKSLYLQHLFYSSQPKRVNERVVGKVVNVAIIGAPNSGKSTLINNIVERKICAASNKVHTTTKMIRAMYFQNDTQIIFLDTPGVVSTKEQKKYKLPESMIAACYKSLRCANVVGVVHDVSNSYTKDVLHTDVVSMLKMVEEIPSFLIINKIDKLKSKKQLLTIIKNLTNGLIAGKSIPGTNKKREKPQLELGYSKFSDVFLVSSLNGDGVSDVKEYLLSNAKPAAFHYKPDEWTDQTPELLVTEAVRAKFLDFLSQELPYHIKIELEYYEEREDKIICSLIAECPTERLVKLIRGAGGGRLQMISNHVRNDLMDLFKKLVVVNIDLIAKEKNTE
ncbi:unnamed protein product [Chilo suppressalis]|uniref:GTPase Era, mitochondrial n=1 Tax=Chilo suppressalis TaxID=168631 RepID=A0ABN8BGY3_CHISP|nr:hypothetical protein evm_000847 [Chilo suppressalis]CAH0407813.1 unnamed protein product [Chilo suppressalis]